MSKIKCPRCGKEVDFDETILTYDYYGIPFRHVCLDCAVEIDERGYDGVKYEQWELGYED